MRDVRRDFPILSRTVHGKPLVYLDNAATSQQPTAVIDARYRYYDYDNGSPRIEFPGYVVEEKLAIARHFLIPRQLAVPATTGDG